MPVYKESQESEPTGRRLGVVVVLSDPCERVLVDDLEPRNLFFGREVETLGELLKTYLERDLQENVLGLVGLQRELLAVAFIKNTYMTRMPGPAHKLRWMNI